MIYSFKNPPTGFPYIQTSDPMLSKNLSDKFCHQISFLGHLIVFFPSTMTKKVIFRSAKKICILKKAIKINKFNKATRLWH